MIILGSYVCVGELQTEGDPEAHLSAGDLT